MQAGLFDDMNIQRIFENHLGDIERLVESFIIAINSHKKADALDSVHKLSGIFGSFSLRQLAERCVYMENVLRGKGKCSDLQLQISQFKEAFYDTTR